ncbi:MAG: 2-C-methyl-D-erythritol 4-phosphate cytidylyltransferase [Candidatus Dormibacterales bacterium]
MAVGAIVAAAGSGSRLGRGSKALVRLNGRTTLARVLELFLALDEVGQIVVVAPPSRLENAEKEVQALHPSKPVIVRAGGESRQASVRAGLTALSPCDYVLVHDAARPLFSAALVRRVLAAAMESGAAFPAISPRDAVKRVEGNRLVESLDRSLIVLAQTPQAFGFELLARAHREAADAGLVGDDDAQLVAATGHAVTVVQGEPSNIKLTTLEDLNVLEALIREQEGPGLESAPHGRLAL